MADTDSVILKSLLESLSGSASVEFQNVLDSVADSYHIEIGENERFDATKLSGAVDEATAPDGKAFLLYVSFRDEDEMLEAVRLLGATNRSLPAGVRFANIDGSAGLPRWRDALAAARPSAPAEEAL